MSSTIDQSITQSLSKANKNYVQNC